MYQTVRNRSLLPWFLISAALAAALCLLLSYRGWAFAGMFALFALAAFAALWLLFALLLALLALFIDPAQPQVEDAPFYHRLVGYGMGLLLAVGRVRVHVRGLERLPQGRFLLVCNHRSNYDPIALGWLLRHAQLAFVSKPENLRIPVVGRILHRDRVMAIDRENDRAALKTILFAVDLIRRGASSVGIFPEGTRSSGAELLPFRNGAFKIAQRARCPVLVAVIRGSEQIRRRAPWRRTELWLDFASVIPAQQVAQMKTNEIGDLARTCMTSVLSADC
ncbi:MAG: 1-acyl-sn-glycerol-3-phosphate acyltransferase [Oscillospiraceae bacterium]|nr:1-acyl-sn-glycerol-3-phosphate acyltransferase [Oscillospiraceae bacterium]